MANAFTSVRWSFLRKFIFRFFFVYFVFQLQPWTWLESIPGISFLLKYYNLGMDGLVEMANKYVFHVREVLVPLNGSGDTSYGWAQLCMILSFAAIGSIIWSIFDRKRPNYTELDYWLRTFIRYSIVLTLFVYGIIKLFTQQMGFPNISQLATPLGDLLPMRFSWLFIGYSEPYQIFSGAMEVLAGLLMLYRRTLNLGLFIAFAVFINVMMLNLCYDVPVKIFSMQLTFACLYLLLNNFKRFFKFFVLNQATTPDNAYTFNYSSKQMRLGRVIFKILFIGFAFVMPLYSSWSDYSPEENKPDTKPIGSGVYKVESFVVNQDSTAAVMPDSLRWKDMIFEKGNYGSINTADTLFRIRYNRAYFGYEVDTIKHLLNIKKRSSDSTYIFNMQYELPDLNTVKLRTKIRNDSLYVVLKKSNRHFQLADRQFHWLSEYNR